MNSVLNPHTQREVDSLLRHTPHAVLLHGDKGAGKKFLASEVARHLLGEDSADSHHIHLIQPEGQTISIAQIRYIKELTKLRVPGRRAIRRVVIIQDAHLLREEAQNALLKTLEEPPEDTVFLLTAHDKGALADTVLSRVTSVAVRPVSANSAKELFSDHDANQVNRAYHMSNGNIGLMSALMQDADHPLLQHIETAKKIIGSSRYQKLCSVESLRNDKEALSDILYCMKRILHYKLLFNPSLTLATRLKHVALAEEDIRRNVQPRLVLTDLFLKM